MLDKIIDGFLQFGLPGVVLAACLFFIYWKEKLYGEERVSVRALQKETMDNLLNAMDCNNTVQRELTIAIYDLRNSLSVVECVQIKRMAKNDRLEKVS